MYQQEIQFHNLQPFRNGKKLWNYYDKIDLNTQ